jgi:hypothetical protein
VIPEHGESIGRAVRRSLDAAKTSRDNLLEGAEPAAAPFFCHIPAHPAVRFARFSD